MICEIDHRMEDGTEGTMAMVGKLKSLEKPLVAVVRLASAVIMPNLMEVPVPVRFIFVLFTPDFSPNMDYHEVGRSFCTLMSHKVKSFWKMISSTHPMSELVVNFINILRTHILYKH